MVEAVAAGVDTASPCWQLDPDSTAYRAAAALMGHGPRGGLHPDIIGGCRVGLFSSGLLYAEGHPALDRLASPGELPAWVESIELALLEAGLPVPAGRTRTDLQGDRHDGFAGFRRLDSTVDLAPATPAEGLAIMAGVAGVLRDAPRSKPNVWWASDGSGRVETVSLHGPAGGRKLARFYDKAVQARTGPPGSLLRPEDQRRWPKGHRRGPEELTTAYVRAQHHRRFLPLWQATKGVTVAGPNTIAKQLADLRTVGQITTEQADKLAGYVLLSANHAWHGSRRTGYRRRAGLRDHGLVHADGVLQEVEVDLHEVLDACMETDAWDRHG